MSHPTAVADAPAASGALLPRKVADSIALLRESVQRYGRVVYSSSLGVESIVLTDLIWEQAPQIDIFTVDTGRLPEQTLELLERIERRYQRRIRVVYPEAPAVQNYVADNGINGFYHSLAQRQACCAIRKISLPPRGARLLACYRGAARVRGACRHAGDMGRALSHAQGESVARLEAR
jgi:phosphoadenosine phosphosulfate reductase